MILAFLHYYVKRRIREHTQILDRYDIMVNYPLALLLVNHLLNTYVNEIKEDYYPIPDRYNPPSFFYETDIYSYQADLLIVIRNRKEPDIIT